MIPIHAELEQLVHAIARDCHADFAATGRRHTHLRLRPEDAHALARHPFADVDLVDGQPTATRFPVLDLGVVTVTQDPALPPGCVVAYTPSTEPWLPGTRDRPD